MYNILGCYKIICFIGLHHIMQFYVHFDEKKNDSSNFQLNLAYQNIKTCILDTQSEKVW